MVTLVIPVFNKAELTIRCLESVLKNSRMLSHLILVDNGSSDDTKKVLGDFKSKFETTGVTFTEIRNAKNLGFGSACNQGIRLATTPYVAILNNDTWVMPDWDKALASALKMRNLDLVGPFFDERPWQERMEARAAQFLRDNRAQYRRHFVPILLFFSESAIARLKLEHGGIFDERFFVTYEDTDLLYRMRQLRMSYAQTSQCFIWHASMGTRSQKNLLPVGYEQAGLKMFLEKWGFDPRKNEHTFLEKIKRRLRKKNAERGKF